MAKYKPGLHKKVLAIFGEEPVVKSNCAEPPTNISAQKTRDSNTDNTIIKKTPESATQSPIMPTTTQAQQQSQPPLPTYKPVEKTHTFAKLKSLGGKITWLKIVEQLYGKILTQKSGRNLKRQKKMAVLVPVLAVVFGLVVVRAFNSSPQKTASAKMLGPSNAVAGSDTRKTKWLIPDVYPDTLRDPMQVGSNAAHAGTGELAVKGIVYSDDKPSAIVGNQIVYVGEKISQATVIKINKDSVEFEINGKKFLQKVQK